MSKIEDIANLSEIIDTEICEFIANRVTDCYKKKIKESIIENWESSHAFPCDINYYFTSETKDNTETEAKIKANRNAKCLLDRISYDPSGFMQIDSNRSNWNANLKSFGESVISEVFT